MYVLSNCNRNGIIDEGAGHKRGRGRAGRDLPGSCTCWRSKGTDRTSISPYPSPSTSLSSLSLPTPLSPASMGNQVGRTMTLNGSRAQPKFSTRHPTHDDLMKTQRQVLRHLQTPETPKHRQKKKLQQWPHLNSVYSERRAIKRGTAQWYQYQINAKEIS